MLTVSSHELGTPEAVWSGWPALSDAPPLDLGLAAPACSRLLVVAPHPDDEVLAAAGLMRRAARQGLSIEIVAVTDGESSHPGWRGGPRRLAEHRATETATALRRLDLDLDVPVERLGLADGEVARREPHLVSRLTTLLDRSAACVAPWRHDGHPDHDATGRAAAAAAGMTGATLVEYPVWAWHWATPSSGLPVERLRRLDLTDADVRAKGSAIDAFGSQTRPRPEAPEDDVVLPAAVVARFRRRFETFFVDGPS